MRCGRIAIALSVVLAGCAGSDDRTWGDARTYEVDDRPSGVSFEVGPVRVEEGSASMGDCAQISVADVPTGCIRVGMGGPGGYSGRALRVDDTRYIDLRTDASARAFVVWSSASPDGREVDPIYAAGNAILVWIMEPGEEPWGVQAIGPDGELGFSVSYVGLPGR